MRVKVKNTKSGVIEFHTEKKAKFLARFKNIEIFWPKKEESKKSKKIEVTSKTEEAVESVSKKTKKSEGKSTADK